MPITSSDPIPEEQEKLDDEKTNLTTETTLSVSLSNAAEDSVSNVKEAEAEWVPPDGGWGWYCVLACFVTFFMIVGMSRSFGIVYLEVKEAFPGTTHMQIAILPSLVTTFTVGFGAISAALTVAFSYRTVAFVGGFLGGVGVSANYFATDPWFMLVAFSIAGIGGGLACTPGILIVSKYFRKRRALAVGLSLAGTAIGSIIQPPLIRFLADEYGFRGAFLIQGGLLFNVCAGALFYRDPIAKPRKKRRKNQGQFAIVPASSAESSTVEVENGHKPNIETVYQHGLEGRYSIADEQEPNRCFAWVNRHLFIDLYILKNPIFLIMLMSSMWLTMAYPQALIFVPPFATSLGYTSYWGGWLLAISSVGDLMGRICSGFIFDMNIVKKQPGFIVCTLTLSLSLIGFPLIPNFVWISVCVYIYGYFAGTSFMLIPVILTEHHGANKLASSYGILRSCQGISVLVGPLLAGYVRDVRGNFEDCFLLMGVLSLLSGFTFMFMIPAKRRYKKKLARAAILSVV